MATIVRRLRPFVPPLLVAGLVLSVGTSPSPALSYHRSVNEAAPLAPSTSGFVLNAVTAVSSEDIWASGVRYVKSPRYRAYLQYGDGTTWNVIHPAPNHHRRELTAIDAVASNDVWAVGYMENELASSVTLIEHWDGTTWCRVPSPNPDISEFRRNYLTGVTAVAADDVWAVGYYDNRIGYWDDMNIEHWDGTRWTLVDTPALPGEDTLAGISAVSDDDIWAVGSRFNSRDHWVTLLEHWDGSSWTRVHGVNPGSRGSGNQLTAVDGLAADDVWTVGSKSHSPLAYHGTTLVEHWDGVSWSVVPSPNPPDLINSVLESVSVASANDVWAVGITSRETAPTSAFSEHWDGTTWSLVPVPDPTRLRLYGVSAVSASDVWAVGDRATSGRLFAKPVRVHWDGTAWTRE